MSEEDQYKNRIELLQGTLDMLILQTLQWGRSMDTESSRLCVCDPEMCFRWRRDLCIRLSIDWSARVGCSLNGSSQRASKKPDITESRPWKANALIEVSLYGVTPRGFKAVRLSTAAVSYVEIATMHDTSLSCVEMGYPAPTMGLPR